MLVKKGRTLGTLVAAEALENHSVRVAFNTIAATNPYNNYNSAKFSVEPHYAILRLPFETFALALEDAINVGRPLIDISPEGVEAMKKTYGSNPRAPLITPPFN